MKGSDRAILLALPALAAVALFWFLLLAPRREEAAKLGEEVASLKQSVAQQQELASAAEEARKNYSRHYYRLVSLGKAVPSDDDTASLLVELQGLADRSGVDFQSITLDESATTAGEATESAAAPPSSQGTPPPSTGEAPGGAAPSTGSASGANLTEAENLSASAPAPATEVGAAMLPIGATVGPAGLPVMPYKLLFGGNFFDVADFVARLDGMIGLDRGKVTAHGRLLTIDGFNLTRPTDMAQGSDGLVASFSVTTYLTPGEEGLTGGATAAGPAPSTQVATSNAGGPAPTTTAGTGGASSPTTTGVAP